MCAKNLLFLIVKILTAWTLTAPLVFAMDISDFSDLKTYFASNPTLGVAQIIQVGPNNWGEIQQEHDPNVSGANFAEIIQGDVNNLSSSNKANASQSGNVNKVYIWQTGSGNEASTYQKGVGNVISLSQNGNITSSNSTLIQDGNNNNINLTQNNGGMYNITQTGNNNSISVVTN